MKALSNSQSPKCLILATLLLVTVSILSGCKSYQLGSPAELPFDSIYIQPVSNDSFAPQAQALLSAQLRDAFIRDGRTKLVTSAEAADAFDSSDTEVASDFDLTLVAQVSLFDQNKGDYHFQERVLQESSNAYVSNPYANAAANTQDFLQSEHKAMPRLTRDLARKIADEVLSPWQPKNNTAR